MNLFISDRRKGGILGKALVLAAVLGAVAVLAWITVLPRLLVRKIEVRAGFPSRVDSLYVNPFAGSLRASGLALENPRGFPNPAFLDVDRFRLDFDLRSLRAETVVLESVDVEIKRLTLVRTADGIWNAVRFYEGMVDGDDGGARAFSREFQMDRVRLRLDELALVDHGGEVASTGVYFVGSDRTHEGDVDLREVAATLAGDLRNVGAGHLTDPVFYALFRAWFPADSEEISPPGVLERTRDAVKKVFESLQEWIR